jgi:hypothetical protein
MTRTFIAPLFVAGLLVSTAAPMWAQAPEEQPAGETGEAGGTSEAEQPSAPTSSALEAIDRLLELELEALEDEAPSVYQHGDRRDPFRSLLVRQNRPRSRGPRPPGIPGLLIDDLSLKGIFMTSQGGVAQVQSSDRTASYLLRKGDRLFDGEVVEIRFRKDEVAEVVFKQGVEDAAAIKPFREVVKKITP